MRISHPIAAIASLLSDHLFGTLERSDDPLPAPIAVVELPRTPGRSGNAMPVNGVYENAALDEKVSKAEDWIRQQPRACANRPASVISARRRAPAPLHDETVELRLVVSNAAPKLELVR